MRASLLLLAVPGAAQQLQPVPDGYWMFHGVDGAPKKVRVACPCGNRPVLAKGEMRACRDLDPSPHRCPRLFLSTGKGALVANSPKR